MKGNKSLYNNMSDQGNISILSNRGLEEIFSYLSIRERIKIQRVCKTWQKVSKTSFHDIHHLEVNSDLFGDNYAAIVFKDLYYIMRQMFSLCGRNLISVSLKTTCLRITGERDTYKLIKKSCPNLQSIYLSYCNKEIIEYFNDNFTDLSSISLERYPQDSEWSLFYYLSNTKNLRSLSIENNDYLIGHGMLCFPTSVESISIKFCKKILPGYIGNVVKTLTNLKSLTLAVDSKFIENMNTILQCIPKKSTIEILDVCCFPVNRAITILDEWKVQNLTNLRVLTLKGSVLFHDTTLDPIAKHCKKLTHVSFIDCEYVITDCVMESFIEALELESLFISKSTIESVRYMTSVNILLCHYCHLLDESSFGSLIEASKNLERLDVIMCKKISAKCLIDTALKAHTRDEILEVNYMDRDNIVNVRITASRLYVMKDSSKLLSK